MIYRYHILFNFRRVLFLLYFDCAKAFEDGIQSHTTACEDYHGTQEDGTSHIFTSAN